MPAPIITQKPPKLVNSFEDPAMAEPATCSTIRASRIILVSNRLPIRFTEDGSIERTHGGLASALEAVETNKEMRWVGWTGQADDEGATSAKMQEEMATLGIEPVFLAQEEVDGFYEGYSNATLWPLLHGMSQRAQFDPDHWRHYREVNAKFADVVLRVARHGDTVWIHDYHLFLLPELLRQGEVELKIGFFLHTPFPSSDVFRVLPERYEILSGLLGADLIGFHTYNYLRHFRSALLRVMGIESGYDSVMHEGRTPVLGVYPIGHNRKGFQQAMATATFVTAKNKLTESL